MVDSAPIESLDATDEPRLEYRSVEGWAFVALGLGLVSALAPVAPVLWILPIAGLLAGAVALVRIRRDALRSGRVVALAGLALSAFFIALPLARDASARWLLASQARPVADQFFEYLRQGSPEKALVLKFVPDFRRSMDESLWLYFSSDEKARADLRNFVRSPPIRMIMALGEKAEVNYYKTTAVGSQGSVAQVNCWYAVTFTDTDGRKKSYFLTILLERKPPEDSSLNPWRVRDLGAGLDPRT